MSRPGSSRHASRCASPFDPPPPAVGMRRLAAAFRDRLPTCRASLPPAAPRPSPPFDGAVVPLRDPVTAARSAPQPEEVDGGQPDGMVLVVRELHESA